LIELQRELYEKAVSPVLSGKPH